MVRIANRAPVPVLGNVAKLAFRDRLSVRQGDIDRRSRVFATFAAVKAFQSCWFRVVRASQERQTAVMVTWTAFPGWLDTARR